MSSRARLLVELARANNATSPSVDDSDPDISLNGTLFDLLNPLDMDEGPGYVEVSSENLQTLNSGIEVINSSSHQINVDDAEFSGDNQINFRPGEENLNILTLNPVLDNENNNIVSVDTSVQKSPVLEEVRKKNYPEKTGPGRKRYRNEESWKFNIARKKRNLGQEYVSVVTKKLIPCREMKPDCKEQKCRQKCYEKFTFEDRKQIFDNFWKIGNHNRHLDFIVFHVKRIDKKSCTNNGTSSRRTYSLEYYLSQRGKQIKVCKKFFLATLSVTDMWIRTAFQKLDHNGVGVLSPDNRGKVDKSRYNNVKDKNLETIRGSIRAHIQMFPRMESHYLRKDCSREYLQEDIQSISEMFRLYEQWMGEKKPIATYRQYREVFCHEYNIGFFVPKKDQCELCDQYKNALGESRRNLEEKIEAHKRNKDTVRDLKEEDKKNTANRPDLMVATFDLQKVLITPHKEVSTFYYKLKYSTYNFTVFDIGSTLGYCYLWHETIAKRGANEIGSCLLNFISRCVETGKREFIFYSDNCGGQNRNRFIFAMYRYAVKKWKVSITHRFLEKGHTQNEGDSVHARIEKEKKGKEIFVPEQWAMIIKSAKKKGTSYQVIEISQEDILDLKVLVDTKVNNWVTDEANKSVKWTEIREISINPENFNIFKIRYDFNEPAVMLDLNKIKKRGRPSLSVERNIPPRAYSQPLPISRKKYDHLQFLCKNIPVVYHDFYKNLPVADVLSPDDD